MSGEDKAEGGEGQGCPGGPLGADPLPLLSLLFLLRFSRRVCAHAHSARRALRQMGLGSVVVPEPHSGRCQPGIVRGAGSAERCPISAGPSPDRDFSVSAPQNARDKRALNIAIPASPHIFRKGKNREGRTARRKKFFRDTVYKGRER